jgi:alpha-tubulin suppressor-like RCC1 family protein
MYGQLGDGTNIDRFTPVQVSFAFGGNIIEISGGRYHSVALKNDSTLWAWGASNYNQLGDDTYIDKNYPVQVNNSCSFTGINEIINKNYVEIFPNPTTNEFRIQNSELKIEKVEIYDAFGKRHNSAFYILHSEFVVDVSQLPLGIYFITVTDGAGNKVTRKVVKM